MRNELSTYPGRIKLVPVPNEPNTFDVIDASEPIVEGTPLTTENLLDDDTAAALGGVHTVNEALNALATKTTDIRITAYMTSGTRTFTVPKSGYYDIEVVGGGGWNDYYSPGGGGAYSRKLVSLVKGQSITVTVGAAATTTTTAGGTTSFGNYVSAPGALSSLGGTASGGDININGGNGAFTGGTSVQGGSALSSPGYPGFGPGTGSKDQSGSATAGCCIITYIG